MVTRESSTKLKHEAKTRLDDDLNRRLREFGLKHSRSDSAVLRLALRFYLDAQETA